MKCPNRDLFLAALLALAPACSPRETPPAASEPAAPPPAAPEPAPLYTDEHASFEKRADDLVSRLSLEEKIGQLMHDAPAVERLGIPAYNWCNEALHGVARAGLATVFPQAIGLAATWDEQLMHEVATAISDEARAKHHAAVARGSRQVYQGLTLWSPNINLFRDPRWGRGQETYGEDPVLTGKLAVQFVRGLQGDDERYLKTAATLKHFAVHSGPEPLRHEFDARIDDHDLYQTYLPHFELGLREGKPASVMCAYNRVNGDAACASDRLLNGILRSDWGFDGFVVSDCRAIEDIHANHHVTKTPAESASLAVKHGTDLECGTVYASLAEAVKKGLVTESELDRSLKRLMLARLRLGMFDDPEHVPYAQIPPSVVDSPEHRALAQRTSEASIVLLKNAKNTLPLRRDVKSIAVIGPNADNWLMLLGNYNGVPAHAVTPLEGIKKVVSPNTRVVYAQGSELAEGVPVFTPVPVDVLATRTGASGLEQAVHDDTALSHEPLATEVVSGIDANWGDGAPRPEMNGDEFGVRWTGRLTPRASGPHQLGVLSTCNTVVRIDGKDVVQTRYRLRDELADPRLKKSEWLELKAGQSYELEVVARETYGDARVQLVWAEPRPNLKREAVAAAAKADAVVMVMGLSANLEGEQLDLKIDGFAGGDRTRLDLPTPQRELVRAIAALHKPTVLVALSGSALALNWEQSHVGAILAAWYPGQAAGDALARVLFGGVSPAGRLPVTFYRSADDLPPFDQYRITTQTYRFFPGQPLYPFGYGLSYTRFHYDRLELPSELEA
ncbi:MAG TPA: glycoside hydrolase family 3 C-terminal domain-containing protein, partial [Polyangiaceae bacterium]|nr:glycoside hydrolase family 3 C-terminal domain-containing protein [Polyangiaceae bacterium]